MRQPVSDKMKTDLRVVLEEAGYIADGPNYFLSSQIESWRVGGYGWQDGGIVYLTQGKESNKYRATYQIWKNGDLKKVLEKVGRNIGDVGFWTRSIQEVDGAVKAYNSLDRRCLVVPRLELGSSDWQYHLYVEGSDTGSLEE